MNVGTMTNPSYGAGHQSKSSQNVSVNVMNNARADVDVQEQDGPDGKMIQIMIEEQVRSSISSGAFDRSMSQSYGVRRRGM